MAYVVQHTSTEWWGLEGGVFTSKQGLPCMWGVVELHCVHRRRVPLTAVRTVWRVLQLVLHQEPAARYGHVVQARPTYGAG